MSAEGTPHGEAGGRREDAAYIGQDDLLATLSRREADLLGERDALRRRLVEIDGALAEVRGLGHMVQTARGPQQGDAPPAG